MWLLLPLLLLLAALLFAGWQYPYNQDQICPKEPDAPNQQKAV